MKSIITVLTKSALSLSYIFLPKAFHSIPYIYLYQNPLIVSLYVYQKSCVPACSLAVFFSSWAELILLVFPKVYRLGWPWMCAFLYSRVFRQQSLILFSCQHYLRFLHIYLHSYPHTQCVGFLEHVFVSFPQSHSEAPTPAARRTGRHIQATRLRQTGVMDVKVDC